MHAMLRLETSGAAVDSALLERSVDEHREAKHPPAYHEDSNVKGDCRFSTCKLAQGRHGS